MAAVVAHQTHRDVLQFRNPWLPFRSEESTRTLIVAGDLDFWPTFRLQLLCQATVGGERLGRAERQQIARTCLASSVNVRKMKRKVPARPERLGADSSPL